MRLTVKVAVGRHELFRGQARQRLQGVDVLRSSRLKAKEQTDKLERGTSSSSLGQIALPNPADLGVAPEEQPLLVQQSDHVMRGRGIVLAPQELFGQSVKGPARQRRRGRNVCVCVCLRESVCVCVCARVKTGKQSC